MKKKNWWQRAVIYEIYLRSFRDSNRDGVGDLPGITEKLPYLATLGVDAIWITPFYESPGFDNGYDISDYETVDPLYGSNEDFDRLLAEAHRLGIRVIIDIVVNHTSDRHPWFLESRTSRMSPKRDWYIWQDEPNNWGSQFDGSAWHYDEGSGQYYLGLFSGAQPDLNWKNPEVREAVYSMMARWAQKGVDGFRLDVISLLAKPDVFDDGAMTDSGYGTWHAQVANNPLVHEYIHEMHERVFAPYSLMTVGEASGVTLEEALKYSAPERKELSMVFQFEHVGLDGSELYKWTHGRIPVEALKQVMSRWQLELSETGWNGLFWCNHDQPRIVSRLGTEGPLRERSAKMLATCLYGMKGTLFLYQGEELGMTNAHFTSADQLRDVECLHAYETLLDRYPEEEALSIVAEKTRDNARTPMLWNAGPKAGFSEGEPWIPVNDGYETLNAEEQQGRSDSVFAYHRELIRLRHENDCLAFGTFRPVENTPEPVYAYLREDPDETLLIVCNFAEEEVFFQIPETSGRKVLLGNIPDSRFLTEGVLAPFEALILTRKTDS